VSYVDTIHKSKAAKKVKAKISTAKKPVMNTIIDTHIACTAADSKIAEIVSS
jgi:hypothetical protein